MDLETGPFQDSASMYVTLSLGANSKHISESNDEAIKLVECYRNRDTKGAITMTVRHLRTTLADIETAHR